VIRHALAIAAASAAAAIVLAGCGDSPSGASTAATGGTTATEEISPAAVGTERPAERQAGTGRPVVIDLVNDTGHSITYSNPHARHVNNECCAKKETVRSGQQAEIFGRTGTLWGQNDIEIDVNACRVGGRENNRIWAYNPDIGYPSVGVQAVHDDWHRYYVDESHTHSLWGATATVTRLPDEKRDFERRHERQRDMPEVKLFRVVVQHGPSAAC